MREPISLSVAVGGVLSTGVALAAVFVPGLTVETQALVIAFGNSVILTGSVVWARSRSTPTSHPRISVGTAVNDGSAVVASVDPPQEPTASLEDVPAETHITEAPE